ncbi:MAG: hypothetical protein A3K19_29970 [Lentisphaerae bacterium RIFOXYB12_FULL_65_16]|nr:MAG: hypothetical protein A3K18_33580 [Lentisphaerae bacterium RIFOXYA12_64_32]OGV86552.1 MAG: hypothetical protein A3K19_29970 [Lentisphaerae bacterium RIFOXYB12_FULL_65_16]
MSAIQRIIITHHTHTDAGYTGTYPDVAVQHIRHLRAALDLCEREPRFRWTIEAGWALDMFLNVATDTERERMRQCLRDGRIELTGFYAQPLTQIANLEELCVGVELTARLAGDLDAPLDTVMLNDVGGLSYNLPQVLARYGIRYVVNGVGGWRVMTPFTTLPHLFRLRGPDGSSVLYYQIKDDAENRQANLGPAQYGFGLIYFLWPVLRELDGKPALVGNDGEKTIFNLHGREGIDLLCERLTRQGYPFDTFLMQFGSDNQGPTERLLEAVDAWNAKHRTPEIQLGTCHDFFVDAEVRWAAQIPEIQGELSCSWSEHVVTNAYATGRYRVAREKLNTWAAAEACCAGGTDEGADAWGDVMWRLVMYHDHTCGLSMWEWAKRRDESGSLAAETFDLPRASWEIKSGYANSALAQVRELAEDQFIALSSDNPDSPAKVSVFNPHSFSYSGPVLFTSAAAPVELVLPGGSVVPVDSRRCNTKHWLHRAWLNGVPPYGVTVCDVRTVKAVPATLYSAGEWELAGPNLIVSVSPQTGAVCGLRSRGSGREWVDASVNQLNEACLFDVRGVTPGPTWGGLNEPVQFERQSLLRVTRRAGWAGTHAATLTVERVLGPESTPTVVETEYILDGSGLRIRNRVTRRHTVDKEALFFAFPIQLTAPWRFDIDQQGQATHFPDERLPGATNHNLAANRFVSVSDAAAQVVLTSRQAAVVALGTPSYYHYGLEYQPIERPTVFSYAFNNLWETNCPILQQGELWFEYHVACREHGYSPVAACQASRKALQAPLVFPGDLPERCGCQATANLLSLSTDEVLVESIRPVGDDQIQVLLTEIGRRDNACTLTLATDIASYAVAGTFGEPLAWQRVGKTPIQLQFRPAEFKVLLLKRNSAV